MSSAEDQALAAPNRRRAEPKVDTAADLGFITLKNPVMPASGTFGYGLELADYCPPEALGAVITKGLSLRPRAGNPSPRIAESPAGLLNSIGLENIGLEAFIAEALPPLLARGAVVVPNILGDSPEEYARLAGALARSGAAFIELNVSCPNVARGGLAFGAEPEATYEVTAAAVEAAGGLPVMVKLTPLAADVVKVALAAQQAGARAVSLINTIPAMAIDLDRRRPGLANVVGGLSGPAVKPVALRQVWLCAQALDIPVVGLGGIESARDALEFILAGARAVQVGTAIFSNPAAPLDILKGMIEWAAREGLSSLDELRGTLRTCW